MELMRTKLILWLLVFVAAPVLAGFEGRWGVVTNGLQLAISPERETWTVGDSPGFQVAFRNDGTNDVFLNLGFTLANGRRHFPDAVSLVLLDSGGHSRRLEVVGPAAIGGRVDDYAVGLQTKAVHQLRLSLSEFWCPSTHAYKLKLPKGHYQITARFQGRGATHKNTGMDWTAWNFWEGTLESGVAEFEIRNSK
jgi:hypothetical protein